MADFLPFRGIYYDPSTVKGDDVVAPPYDIISPSLQDELYGRSPHNVVRIDFGKGFRDDTREQNRYTRAADFLSSWLSSGVLVRHPKPAFFLYEAVYSHGDSEKRLRGVIGRLKLVELGQGVYPHEETHSAPKEDRLNIMRYCKANVSPIFSLVRGSEESFDSVLLRAASGEPCMEATDSAGAVHRMWIIDDEESVRSLVADVRGKPIFIADGHHRYETALTYSREAGAAGDAPSNYVMMFLANMASSGLTILPTHRLVRSVPGDAVARLGEFFHAEVAGGREQMHAEMATRDRAVGMYLRSDGRFYVLHPRGGNMPDVPPVLRELDVVALHELIFKKILGADIISYEMDGHRCIAAVREGAYDAAFFLNPTRVQDIERVAMSGLRMPPKSTYFYPKLLTGFVIHSFV